MLSLTLIPHMSDTHYKKHEICLEPITVNLKKVSPPLSKSESANIVYEDADYSYELTGEEIEQPISSITLFISKKEINMTFIQPLTSDGKKIIRMNAESNKLRDPFFMIFGMVQILVEIKYTNQKSSEYYYSPYLAVAINNSQTDRVSSVKSMLDYIFKEKHSLLNQEIFTYISYGSTVKDTLSENQIDDKIFILKEFANRLKKLVHSFIQDPQTNTHEELNIDYINKLQNINSCTLQYIITHPDLLVRSDMDTGIYINGFHMLPRKALVTHKIFDFNIPENEIILSFIFTLLQEIKNQKYQIANIIDLNEIQINTKQPVHEGYLLSAGIIDQYIRFTYQQFLDTFQHLENMYEEIFLTYKNAIPCHYKTLIHMPPVSPVFLEINHYRCLYEMIKVWFQQKENVTNNYINKIHFMSADSIYEYYCLLMLYEIIVECGFKEDFSKRKYFPYRCPIQQNLKMDNTYYFYNSKREIILYFQPVVYSEINKGINGISLFRSDRDFFIPDFVLKLIQGQDSLYGIIDAKWRDRKTLLNSQRENTFPEMNYKYRCSINDANNIGRFIPFFWLLQGKDTKKGESAYYLNSGGESRHHSTEFQNASGIVTLTPQSGKEECKKILSIFLNSNFENFYK